MSLALQAKVYAMKIGDPVAKTVLSYLAYRSNHETGECFPSIDTMVSDLEYGRATILRKLPWLEKHGYLRVKRPARAGRGTANQYYLTLEKGSRSETLSEGGYPRINLLKGSRTAGKKVPERVQKRSQPDTPTKKGNKKEPKRPAAERQPPQCVSSDEPAPANASSSLGMSASLASLDSRVADIPSGGQLQPDTPAQIETTISEAPKRGSDAKPVLLDRPIITAEQRRENEAVVRLNADLMRIGLLEAAMEWLNDDRRARAVAAEVAERGAGASLMRSEMLQTSNHANKEKR